MIIDSHIHFGDSVRMNCKTNSLQLIQEMDKNDISVACCSHMEALLYSMESGNTKMQELAAKHPGRILGYCAVPSSRLASNETEKYIYDCVTKHGMIGVKLYSVPFPGTDRVWIPAARPLFRPVLSMVQDLGVPLLIHASPQEVDLIATWFPELTIIMAHSGNAPEMHGLWHEAVHVAKNS
jgi:uncharacterized protein